MKIPSLLLLLSLGSNLVFTQVVTTGGAGQDNIVDPTASGLNVRPGDPNTGNPFIPGQGQVDTNNINPVITDSGQGQDQPQGNNDMNDQNMMPQQQYWQNYDTSNLTADNSVIVFMNFQEGQMRETAEMLQGQLVDYRRNAQGLNAVSQLFGIPTFLVSQDNETYGSWWPSLNTNINAQSINLPFGIYPFTNEGILSQIEQTGRRNIIIAALTADSGLTQAARMAQRLGYQVYPVVDASPYTEQGGFQMSLQKLGVYGIPAQSWLEVARALSYSRRNQILEFNDLLRQYQPDLIITNTTVINNTRRFL